MCSLEICSENEPLGWRDHSAVSIFCSSRGPSPQYPQEVAHLRLQRQLLRADTSGLSGYAHSCAFTQTWSHTQWGTEKHSSFQIMDSSLHSSCWALKKSLYITCFLLHTFIEIHCMRHLHPTLKLWYNYNSLLIFLFRRLLTHCDFTDRGCEFMPLIWLPVIDCFPCEIDRQCLVSV